MLGPAWWIMIRQGQANMFACHATHARAAPRWTDMATISIPRRRPLALPLPHISSEGVIYGAVFLIVANLVLVPLALVLLEAFNLGPIHGTAAGATLDNFITAWSSPVTHAVLLNTLVFGVSST